MTLIILTVVVIALMIAALVVFLFAISVPLNRTADSLDDCVQNVKNIAYQAEVIGPAIERINETGATVVGALPLLCEAAERIGAATSQPAATSEPYVDPPGAPSSAASPTSAVASPVAPSASPARGVGYLDGDGDGGNLGYLDA